jgi:hypothetical protein
MQLNRPKVLTLVVDNVGGITHNLKSAYQVSLRFLKQGDCIGSADSAGVITPLCAATCYHG